MVKVTQNVALGQNPAGFCGGCAAGRLSLLDSIHCVMSSHVVCCVCARVRSLGNAIGSRAVMRTAVVEKSQLQSQKSVEVFFVPWGLMAK